MISGYLKHLNITFGEKIAILRKQLKWPQEDLAKKIGTSGPIVGRYERGNITPSIDVVSKIADALEVTIDELAYGNQNNKAEQNIKDRELLSMFSKIQLLNEKQKETVKDFLSAYILKVDLKEKLIV